jgi:hypothetical protein
MHPTADTTIVIYFQTLGAAGDAGRYVAPLPQEGERISAAAKQLLTWPLALA